MVTDEDIRIIKKQLAFKGIKTMGDELIALADGCGLVVTIEQKPLQPLAMGNYETVVSVREKRS